MKYKRNLFKRKIRRKKIKSYGRYTMKRMRLGPNPKIFNYVRKVPTTYLTVHPEGGLPLPQTKSLTFKLNQLPAIDLTAFQTLYEAYRIYKIKIVFYPTGVQLMTSGANADSNNAVCPVITYAIDYNDASLTFTSDQDLLEYRLSGRFLMTKKKVITIYPKTVTEVYTEAVGTSGYKQNSRKDWLDTSYPDIDHYGLKLYISGNEFANVFEMRPVIYYYLQFKDPK